MVHKRAVRKQQDTSRLGRQSSAGGASQPVKVGAAKAVEDRLVHLRPIADAISAAVAQCVQDADPEAVHRARTGSRRLQATLEAMLRETGAAGNALRQPTRAWLRQLKRVRRAAGPVRDLDVHRTLLENWIEKTAPKQDATNVDGEGPMATSDTGSEASLLRSQAERLDAWLKGERKRLAHGMQKQIRKRQQALAEKQSEFFAVVDCVQRGRSKAPRPADAVALEDFMRVSDAMPLLHAENLHDFRKATKKARYVAESGRAERSSSSVAKALKRIQDAIGIWHDWLCLAKEATAALGQDAPELTASFEHEVDRQFAAAMKTTQNMRGRLEGEWLAARGSKALSQPPAKRPPAALAIDDRRIASSF
jgi:CHAD domain-containing protein